MTLRCCAANFRKAELVRLNETVGVLLLLALVCTRYIAAQSSSGAPQDPVRYGFKVSVDEVDLTFHAAGMHGQPVNDLKLDELRIFDNEKPPGKILAFYSSLDEPVRAGILMDTSESMVEHVLRSRAIALKYAEQFVRPHTDKAFVMDFGYVSKITQTWTGDPVELIAGMRNVIPGRENPLGGTALFDTLLSACLYEFGRLDPATGGNFILLFSDGEDNASHSSLNDVVDTCQRSNTAIYAFHPEPTSMSSTGLRTLMDLTSETGGRLFHEDEPDAGIDEDLRIIEADLRNQYHLVYKPAELKRDGSFHRIAIIGPDRVNSITVRSGYYAPER
jgi:Ca-activated chloride channel homolog